MGALQVRDPITLFEVALLHTSKERILCKKRPTPIHCWPPLKYAVTILRNISWVGYQRRTQEGCERPPFLRFIEMWPFYIYHFYDFSPRNVSVIQSNRVNPDRVNPDLVNLDICIPALHFREKTCISGSVTYYCPVYPNLLFRLLWT